MLARGLPHDLTNGLAAAALVLLETGARRNRRPSPPPWPSFAGPPHRIELGGRRRRGPAGTTTPRRRRRTPRRPPSGPSTSVVLIAGGLNKGLDLRADGPPSGGVHPCSSSPSAVAAEHVAARVRPRRAGRAEQGRWPRRWIGGGASSLDTGRRRPALARLRQLRLVPRRRLPGARRRLPSASWTSGSEAQRDDRSTRGPRDRVAASKASAVTAAMARASIADRRRGALERLHGGADKVPARRPPPEAAALTAPRAPIGVLGRAARTGAGRVLRAGDRRRRLRDARPGHGPVGVGPDRGGVRATAPTRSSTDS